MTPTIDNLLKYIDKIAPFALAESWDNCGLLIGAKSKKVKSILVGLDPSSTLLKEAKAKGCDTIITHHPIIFRPLPTIDTDTPVGSFIRDALATETNVIACHTNLDSAVDGVSDILGNVIGLKNMQPMVTTPTPGAGLGRIGALRTPSSGQHFIHSLLDSLGLDTINVAGKIPEKIKSVALCGGSGSELAPKAKTLGADIYLTAEVKHSTARWAEEAGYCVIDGTHYATEKFAIQLLKNKLEAGAAEYGWKIEIHQTETEKHPFVSINKNSLS